MSTTAPRLLSGRSAECELDAKVELLRDAARYPERPHSVEVRETHYSFVFLLDEHVYKLKKPARVRSLDYSTPDLRRRHCESEVALNSRLAPHVYLGCVPITRDAHGRLALDGAGEPVDWLVKMLRLPEERTLEHAIRSGREIEGDVRRLAGRLARFFAEAPEIAIDPDTYRRDFEAEVAHDAAVLSRPTFAMPAHVVDAVALAQLALLEGHGSLFDARATDFRIVEGHGDLRPEHVYLNGEPLVLDCLEFDARLRALDPADELAFLAMECECLGAPRVKQWLFEEYEGRSGDVVVPELAEFYSSRRAMARARMSIAHLEDPRSDRARWTRRALGYLDVALAHARTAA